VATGKVEWFNPVMGHGYIKPADGGTDVPVRRLAVELAGHTSLKPGQQVATSGSFKLREAVLVAPDSTR